MKILIEKNVAMPGMPRRGRANIYPFAQMEIGDSFFVPNMNAKHLITNARAWSKKHEKDYKFVVAEEVEGARLWRSE